jgi:WD40 repeat protein
MTVRQVWDRQSGGTLRILKGHTEVVWNVQIYGDKVITRSEDKLIRVRASQATKK